MVLVCVCVCVCVWPWLGGRGEGLHVGATFAPAAAAAAAAGGECSTTHSCSPHSLKPTQLPACLRPACPLQGLELLDGQLCSGLPFDLGSSGANEGFSSMTQATHDRLGSGQLMPAELFRTGG
jgi:hypothetical protein